MQASNLEIIKLNNLKLAAKIISEQLKHGVHLGKRVGVGSEFEQYRYYEPGDDPKRIDWKYFSRSGKYMIKESQTESHLHVRMMLDLSGSMNYEEDGIKRLDYAKNLIASLSYLAHQQGDSLTYFTFQDGKIEQKVSASPKSFQRILYYLETETAAGSWPVMKHEFPVLKSKEKELIILVSDFLQKDNEWLDIVEQMRHPKKEIVLFQILGKQEEKFDLKGNFNFQDLESDRSIILDGKAIEKTYNESIKNYLSGFKQSLILPQVHLFQARLTDSIAGVISQFLAERSLS
ncbi:DUF58 domain-containing protein [Algoriphagus aquimarinus]|uniref:DUF58 domain-containing protein n=1 Tax=Algoriphagus aquimarinus TaxID=237018 RepID=A0A5C7AYR5_9BACT|nr:DUF58 domain-containing protein [Algoriphagus aquimarinus]TXE13284.1 DUF58 domain-containing protein [Algoriphagus aquimarinus]